MEKQAPDPRQPDGEAEKPTEGRQLGRGAARAPGSSSSSEEKPDAVKQSSKKKVIIPQIIVTRASTETLDSQSSLDTVEQRTIREQPDWGPYCRHRNPSTADAYGTAAQE
ncbi:spermatogenesis-associated protein 33 isoform X2 [Tamandua tetradactyla]